MKTPFLSNSSFQLSVVATTVLASSTLLAQPRLEEVIVTATKRLETMQDVPISMQSLDGGKIKDAGIQNIEDLSAYIPNFSMTESAVGNVIFIRGIGSGINQGFEQSVGMFIDGIYAGRSQQFRTPFLDIARVEVLKGPQGTLFGKNTIAGAVNITTNEPSAEFEGEVSALYEPKHGEKETTIILSGPITETIGGRLAARYAELDGFLENTISGQDEPQREEYTVRGTLQWQASDNINVIAKIESGSFEVDGRALQASNINGEFITATGLNLGSLPSLIGDVENGKVDDKKTSATFPGLEETSKTDNNLAAVTIDWDIDEFTLTSITGYSSYEFDESADVDFTSMALLHQINSQEFDQWSQEIRLTSPIGETFEYIAGLYWQQQTLTNDRFLDADGDAIGGLAAIVLNPYSNSRPFEQDSSTYAAFAQGTWNITDQLRFTMGLRWSQEDKEAKQSIVVTDFGARDNVSNPDLEDDAARFGTIPHSYDESRSSSNLSPSFNLQYDLNDDAMLYARIAKGFKSGGFNEAESSGDVSQFEFDDEQATSYELGTKLTLLNGAATLNGNIFYTEYTDRQVSAFEGVQFVVGNAAESTTQGIEIDGRWAVTEKLQLGLSAAYLDSTFDDFSDAGCTAQQTIDSRTDGDGDSNCTQDLSGKDTEFAPEWTANLNATYIQPIGDYLELISQIDANYSDSYYFAQDLDTAAFQESSTKWNARLALSDIDRQWELALIGKNLTDEKIKTHGNDIALFLGAHYVFVERPRSIALQGTLRF